MKASKDLKTDLIDQIKVFKNYHQLNLRSKYFEYSIRSISQKSLDDNLRCDFLNLILDNLPNQIDNSNRFNREDLDKNDICDLLYSIDNELKLTYAASY